MLDWVIRGGTVIDGSGGAPFRADIGIRGGKIAAVGSCGEAAQTLDAAGGMSRRAFWTSTATAMPPSSAPALAARSCGRG